MSIYICEKCGTVDNTAIGGYWSNVSEKEDPKCSECNTGKWHGQFPKKNWSEYGTEEDLLRMEALRNGSHINATKYFSKLENEI